MGTHIIEYYKKDVYGQTRIYAADPKVQSRLKTLTGMKTLTEDALEVFKDFGFKVVEVLPPKT